MMPTVARPIGFVTLMRNLADEREEFTVVWPQDKHDYLFVSADDPHPPTPTPYPYQHRNIGHKMTPVAPPRQK
jgi:hypothetical protein